MYLATVLAGLGIVLVLLVYWLRGRKKLSKPRICILVLGDIGRSPRMQYHALSCAKAGYHVDLVGFGGICTILAILSTGEGVEFVLHTKQGGLKNLSSISVVWEFFFFVS